ncbi:hypothetical protein MN608_03602 [Microdochium nivale]|nr:hypothetical protein MN608_03602 [Microdochium nivale]
MDAVIGVPTLTTSQGSSGAIPAQRAAGQWLTQLTRPCCAKPVASGRSAGWLTHDALAKIIPTPVTCPRETPPSSQPPTQPDSKQQIVLPVEIARRGLHLHMDQGWAPLRCEHFWHP